MFDVIISEVSCPNSFGIRYLKILHFCLNLLLQASENVVRVNRLYAKWLLITLMTSGDNDLFAVYIPPDADTSMAIRNIEEFVDQCIINQPDSAVIIVGDFNKARLTIKLHQYVSFNTREQSKLDLCYCNIKGAYKSYRLPPIGTSDHCPRSPTYQHIKSRRERRSLNKSLTRKQ